MVVLLDEMLAESLIACSSGSSDAMSDALVCDGLLLCARLELLFFCFTSAQMVVGIRLALVLSACSCRCVKTTLFASSSMCSRPASLPQVSPCASTLEVGGGRHLHVLSGLALPITDRVCVCFCPRLARSSHTSPIGTVGWVSVGDMRVLRRAREVALCFDSRQEHAPDCHGPHAEEVLVGTGVVQWVDTKSSGPADSQWSAAE